MSAVSHGDLIQVLVSFAVPLRLMERRRREEEEMIIALYIVAAVIMAIGSLYFAWRNRDFRKFLAGAFFMSSGILFYLSLADVSELLFSTSVFKPPNR